MRAGSERQRDVACSGVLALASRVDLAGGRGLVRLPFVRAQHSVQEFLHQAECDLIPSVPRLGEARLELRD
jgi:hypothetical protein